MEDLIPTGQAVEMLTFLALMPEVAGGVEEDLNSRLHPITGNINFLINY